MDLRHVEHIYKASCIRPLCICVRKPTFLHRRELGFSTAASSSGSGLRKQLFEWHAIRCCTWCKYSSQLPML